MCLYCHNPHASKAEKLIVSEGICYTCHDKDVTLAMTRDGSAERRLCTLRLRQRCVRAVTTRMRLMPPSFCILICPLFA
jgi:predicted CXXCH cytochrome family protein